MGLAEEAEQFGGNVLLPGAGPGSPARSDALPIPSLPRRSEEYSTDSWLDYCDSIPILVASLDKLAELGLLGEVWWRYGRDGLLSLTDALDNPGDHAAYKRRQADRKAEEERKHREAMELLACVDCGAVPERKAVWTEEIRGYWTHRKGGTCHPCHQEREAARTLREDQEALEAARAAHAKRPSCWTCKGPLGGSYGSEGELREQAPMRVAECPDCAAVRKEEDFGPLWLPLPTAKEWKLFGKKKLDDPWWEVRVLHAELCPAVKRPKATV